MLSNQLEYILIESIDEQFKNAAKDYVIKESTDTPFLQVVLEMTLYNYFVVRASVEKNTIFFSILQSGFQFSLLDAPLSDGTLKYVLSNLSDEVKLRIPEKYLKAKGW